MVDYRKYILNNGLSVLTHEAWDSATASVNLLYNVGARNESPHLTGFAHLFEHLMFSGTRQVPDFDGAVSSLGGDSNAMTNNDYTDYYMTVPAPALFDALRLEADRMTGLVVDEQALRVQQRVVTEEYHQRYLNHPYGDLWLLLRPLCYTCHPYRWPTIGADIRHVSEASLADVQAFHKQHYRSANAVLSIAAPCTHAEMLGMAERAWNSPVAREEHGDAEPSMAAIFSLTEPEQTSPRSQHVQRDVPTSMVVLAYPMCDHFDPRFRHCDLLSDLLSNGKSSRLYTRLVKEQRLMVEADAYLTGDASQGLMVVSGKLSDGVGLDQGAEALRRECRLLAEELVSDYELRKVVNKYENTFAFSQYKASDRAFALSYYTWLGKTRLINDEPAEYAGITPADLADTARWLFDPRHENLLYYEAAQH